MRLNKYSIAFLLISIVCLSASAQESKPMVRLAKIVIDFPQLDRYKDALREEVEASVRLEPGVLSLYPVFEKENPTRLTILEIYADSAAYKSHLKTSHFIKYKTQTKEMVKSLELVEVVPLLSTVKIK